MAQTEKTDAKYCRLCGHLALHTITDDRQETSHLCCTHYQKIFLSKGKQCPHTNDDYPVITCPPKKFKGYTVIVSYRVLPEAEVKMKRQFIIKTLLDAALKQEMEKRRKEMEKE